VTGQYISRAAQAEVAFHLFVALIVGAALRGRPFAEMDVIERTLASQGGRFIIENVEYDTRGGHGVPPLQSDLAHSERLS